MSDTVIRVENLGKKYRLGLTHDGSIRELANRWTRKLLRRPEPATAKPDGRSVPADDQGEFWALRDVSFEVRRGEVLGVIGRNGAGKSTLLKILSQITKPTTGRAEIRGRVASLLEVGTGFHPELTGRENVYLNGAILGMTRAEVRRKFDEIVAFSGVEKFVDTPVKRYSSGMHVRLGFAVAAHLEPEILIVDEVLAVGDAEFQRRCLGKMQDVATSGRTVLFVSHNMAAVRSLCTRGLLIEAGKAEYSAPANQVVDRYLTQGAHASQLLCRDRTDRKGSSTVLVTNLTVTSVDGGPVLSNSPLKFTVEYESTAEVLVRPRFVLGVYDKNEASIFRFDTDVTSDLPRTIPGTGAVECKTGPLNASAGWFSVNVAVYQDAVIADHLQRAAAFEVSPCIFFGAKSFGAEAPSILVPHQWGSANPPNGRATSLARVSSDAGTVQL